MRLRGIEAVATKLSTHSITVNRIARVNAFFRYNYFDRSFFSYFQHLSQNIRECTSLGNIPLSHVLYFPHPKFTFLDAEAAEATAAKTARTAIGVLWLENEVIQNSENTINKFLEHKKDVFYVTNNNSKTREEYVKKCDKLGFKATKDNIISTAYLAADYLSNLGFDKKVYIIGQEAIVKELNKVKIRSAATGPDVMDTDVETYIQKLNLDPEIGAVFVGFDQHISYPKLMKASTYLRDPNVHFVAACTDESFPVSSNLILPGTGCTVRYLEAATGRKAVVMGKPNDYIKNAVFKKQNLDPARTLMIGDRCNTDILFGKRCGFQTLLVLTGVTSLDDVEKYSNSTEPSENDLVPQYYIDKLGDLLPYL